MICNGIPRASHTWMCPMVGGLLITQFATNGRWSGSSGSGWETAGQQDLMISRTMADFLGNVDGCRASPQTEPPVCTLEKWNKIYVRLMMRVKQLWKSFNQNPLTSIDWVALDLRLVGKTRFLLIQQHAFEPHVKQFERDAQELEVPLPRNRKEEHHHGFHRWVCISLVREEIDLSYIEPDLRCS